MYLVTTLNHGYDIPHHLSYSNFHAWKFVPYSTNDEQHLEKSAVHELIYSLLAQTRLGLLGLITVAKSQIRVVTCLAHSMFHYYLPTPYDLLSLQNTQLNFEQFDIL
jgi:hypothetical protein